MPANYDLIACLYDPLSRVVFGRTLERAQEVFLPAIPAGSSVLIVGGGTGAILERLARLYPSGLDIHYVESSARMIAMAERRNCAANIVRFINLPIEQYHPDLQFDFIITPFLFDNFTPAQAASVFGHISSVLKPTGSWLYTDYYIDDQSPVWQKILLWAMYRFFRIVSGVEAEQMPEMRSLFALEHEVLQRRTYWHGFIDAIVYRRK